MMSEKRMDNLISLSDCEYQQKHQQIREQTKHYPKYFYDVHTNRYLIYSQSSISIIAESGIRMIDLGTKHPIIKLSFNE